LIRSSAFLVAAGTRNAHSPLARRGLTATLCTTTRTARCIAELIDFAQLRVGLVK
jgi:hypothetical protein